MIEGGNKDSDGMIHVNIKVYDNSESPSGDVVDVDVKVADAWLLFFPPMINKVVRYLWDVDNGYIDAKTLVLDWKEELEYLESLIEEWSPLAEWTGIDKSLLTFHDAWIKVKVNLGKTIVTGLHPEYISPFMEIIF